MASATNKLGLSRDIPAHVKREVRRACGYGCVVCGLAVAQYEHFAPPFDDATEHRVEGIALLCGACHDKKGRGIWSTDRIAKARANPTTFRNGSAYDAFNLAGAITVWLGSSTFENVSSIVRTREGQTWLAVHPPEEPGGPFQLSAEFADEAGVPSLVVDRNEWRVFSHHWDTEVVGATIKVRRAPRELILQLTAKPPNGLVLERLVMRKAGIGIEVTLAGQIGITRDGTTWLDECLVQDADSVFLI